MMGDSKGTIVKHNRTDAHVNSDCGSTHNPLRFKSGSTSNKTGEWTWVP